MDSHAEKSPAPERASKTSERPEADDVTETVLHDARPARGAGALIRSSLDLAQMPLSTHGRVDHGGLGARLKAGIEHLSGVSFNGVQVHRNSLEPGRIGAAAFARGRDIHLGPGQERHLPHEAWHLVQQAKGQVRATGLSQGVPVNDEIALEREADVMGEKALTVDIATPGAAPARPATDLAQADGPAQLRLNSKGVSYSFLGTYDRNGNPFLASKGKGKSEDLWKFKTDQTDLKVEKVDDLFTAYDEEEEDRIFHNLSFGRQQAVSFQSGQKAVYEPFKSYQFGADTRPEVAMYPVGEDGTVGKAPLYPDLETELRKKLKEASPKSEKERKQVISIIQDELEPLFLAEEYRTPGAWKAGLERIDDFVKLKPYASPAEKRKSRRKVAKKAPRKDDLSFRRARDATSGLPFAGTGGKDKFRKSQQAAWGWEFHESSRDVFRRGISPEKDSPGRWFESDEEEDSSEEDVPSKKRASPSKEKMSAPKKRKPNTKKKKK